MARAETAAAAPAPREPLTAQRPAPPLVEPAPSWTPEETIVEPGWPLPGEIAGGGWSAQSEPPAMATVPEQAAPPVAVIEWEPTAQPAPDAPGDPVEPAADLPAEEWAMPSFDGTAPDGAPPRPLLWVPGETEVSIVPSAEGDSDRPLWPEQPEHGTTEESAAATAPPAPVGAPPAIAWGPAVEIPAPPPEGAGATDGLVWADASPAGPDVEPVCEPLPGPAVEVAPALEPVPEPVAEPAPVTEPEPVVAVAWGTSPEGAEAMPSITAATPFGTLTPAPVWPPADASAPLLAAEEPWTPAPPAASPQVAAVVPLTRVCDRMGVTPRMLVLLRVLAQTPRSVSEQARELGVSRPLVADLCARLENAGLVRREPVPTDRRRVRITATAAGHRLEETSA